MPMKQIILETAQAWVQSRSHEGHEIMTQIVDTITIENMKEKNDNSTRNNTIPNTNTTVHNTQELNVQ